MWEQSRDWLTLAYSNHNLLGTHFEMKNQQVNKTNKNNCYVKNKKNRFLITKINKKNREKKYG